MRPSRVNNIRSMLVSDAKPASVNLAVFTGILHTGEQQSRN
jgi:hypothetical protein